MTTVDREQLITLLAERTGMDQAHVDQQLVELIDHIREAEAEQDAFEIEGFGTFNTVRDGLEFVPSAVLSTEINNKYAGMKPIELIGAFKEPEGKDIPVADQPGEMHETREADEAAKKEKQQPSAKDSDLPSPEPAVPESASAGAPADTAAADEIPTAAEKPGTAPSEQEHLPEEPAVSAVPAETAGGDTAATESLDKDPLGKAIVILVVILTLAVAGWLAYDLGLFGSGAEGDNDASSSAPPAQQQNTEQQFAALPGGTQPGNAEHTGHSAASPGQQDGEGNERPASTVETETYGLYGEINHEINGYFTIVVHSLRTMELAEEKKQPLDSEGFRTRINETDVNGRTHYRVGIGQFSTIQAAQQAVRELPEPYRSNNFINRF